MVPSKNIIVHTYVTKLPIRCSVQKIILCSLIKIDFPTLHINSTLETGASKNPAVSTINLDLNI